MSDCGLGACRTGRLEAGAWSGLAVGSEAHTFVLCKYLIGSFFIMAFIPFRLTLIIIINNVILLASFILLASINVAEFLCWCPIKVQLRQTHQPQPNEHVSL